MHWLTSHPQTTPSDPMQVIATSNGGQLSLFPPLYFCSHYTHSYTARALHMYIYHGKIKPPGFKTVNTEFQRVILHRFTQYASTLCCLCTMLVDTPVSYTTLLSLQSCEWGVCQCSWEIWPDEWPHVNGVASTVEEGVCSHVECPTEHEVAGCGLRNRWG